MIRSYKEFLEDLGFLESSNIYENDINPSYLGRYQMGEAALICAGYYTWEGDATRGRKHDWTGKWTGLDGVHSKDDFLKNHDAQDNAVLAFHQSMWRTIKIFRLDYRFVGQTFIINGKRIPITEFGILAGAHLKGIGRAGSDDQGTQGGAEFFGIWRKN